VDEEHDASLQTRESVIYNARDYAVLRASWEDRTGYSGVRGHRPLESLHNARTGRYGSRLLPETPRPSPMPDIGLIDIEIA